MKNDDKKVRIKLERHIWPDEAHRIEDKRNKRLVTVFVIVSMLFVFVVGWLIGSARPIIINPTPEQQTESKLDKILGIMSNNWYFAKDDEKIVDHLLDQALYGMTSNEVDPHTTYLSSDELQYFMQSINMNFVGIGVQYISSDGLNMIDRVFKNSPAEEAGVLPGDIINKIDGVSVEGLTSDDIKDMVRGEEGSKVVIEFLRQGTPIELEITRREVYGTANGKMVEDGIGYIEIYQFGDSTAEEVGAYLQDLTDSGMTKLIIDLRDNGGGYLDALVDIASYFVDKNEIVMKQEYADGTIRESYAKEGKFTNIDEIVILVNENTASASEVLTLTLEELRDDVTVLGTTTYGKGTVQITQPFEDGSALKYTTSKWLSPSGKSINGVGIVPDVEIRLHDVLYESYVTLEEGMEFKIDQVSNYVKIIQEGLDFLDYSIDRKDGYFDKSTETAIKKFEEEHNLEVDGILDTTTFDAILSSITKTWSMSKDKDIQYHAAIDLLNEQ
ncbi:S41 family peptidase [Anaerorhabdus sp.]|uniref:S41 family peptidase n=1 Tax=Anaerorhabdus sp. TaxID=1872524 RepID=UPI002B1F0C56|nr:S41 family peptidase [Anaerorhabdus sp.]MEA4874897.1 S41 family peptidase [Anaerorhabdus sp.]